MRRIASLVPVFAIACGAPLGERELASDVAPLRHEVDVIVDRGVVGMTVNRAFQNGPDAELELSIPLPTGASVDAFSVGIDGEWYEGDLLEADAASERYLGLAGLVDGRYATETFRPPFLLSWAAEGELLLEAHPVPAGALVELRYHLTAPTCHLDGRAVFDYPSDALLPQLFGAGEIRAPRPDEDWDPACGEDTTLQHDEDRLIVGLDPLETGRVEARWSETTVGDQQVGRFAIDLPAQLAEIPTNATVVFLVDGSISQHDEHLATQLAWAEAYLAWVPDASVQVVVFHRFAETLFDGFVPASQFDAMTDGVQYEPQNGSNLDEGLALVGQLVAGRSNVRVVTTSDLLMKADFDGDAAAEILASTGAIVHVLELTSAPQGWPTLEETTSGRLHGLHGTAAGTGGLFGRLSGDPTHDAAIEVAEELVRPIRLHVDDRDLTLERGETFRVWEAPQDSVPGDVGARLWTRRIRIDLTRAPDDAMAALIIGSSYPRSEHSAEAIQDLAMRGGVVSPYTSYLAESGGAPVVPDAAQFGGIGGIGMGSSWSCGCCGGRGFGMAGYGSTRSRGWLERAVRDAAAACGVASVHATIETTLDEIVDVIADDECVAEQLWSTRLPAWFAQHRSRYYEVAL